MQPLNQINHINLKPLSQRPFSISKSQSTPKIRGSTDMRPIAKTNYLPKTSMAFSDPAYVSRIRPRQINIDKERLYEENLILKQLCNTISEENTQLKTKLSQLEKELEKNQQSTSPDIKSTSHLVENLKTVIRDVKAELQAKDKELDLLKRSTRLTKMQEMGEELQQYANECMRLKRMLMEVVNDKKPWPDNSGFLEQLQNEREQLQQALRFYQDSDALKSEEIVTLKKQLKKNDPEKDTSKKLMKDELEKLKNQLNDERKINELKPEKNDVAMQSSLAREEEEKVNEVVKNKDEEIRNLYLEMSAMEKKATRQEKIIAELQKEIKDLNSRAIEDTKKKELINAQKELINGQKDFEVASTKVGIKLEDSYKKLEESIKSDAKSESSEIKSKNSETSKNEEEFLEKNDPVQEISSEKDYNEEESYKEQQEFENPNEDVYIPDDKIELESAKLNPKEEEGLIISFLMKIKYFLMQNKLDIQEWVSDIDINKIGIINLDDLQTVLSQEAINLSQNEYDCFMKRFGENDHQVLVSVLIEELANMEMDDISDTSYDSNNKENSWILKIDKSLVEIAACEIGTRFNYNVVRDKKKYIELILNLEEYDKDSLEKLFTSENILIEKDSIREALILSILDEKDTVTKGEIIEKLGFLLRDWKPLSKSEIEGVIRRLRSLLMDEIDVIGSRVEEKSQGNDLVPMNIIIEELRIHRIISQKSEFSWAMTQLFSYNQSIYKVPYKQALEDMQEGIPFTDLNVYENPETSQIEAGSAVFEESIEEIENNPEPQYKEEYQESFNSDIDEN